MDAAIIQACVKSGEYIEIIIPFIPRLNPKEGKIYLPKILNLKSLDPNRDFKYFLEGIYSHPQVAGYWSKCIDLTPW